MLMEIMKCPDCGAQLHFEPEQEYCYCSHCGTQVYKEDIHFDKRLDANLKLEKAKMRHETIKNIFLYAFTFGLAILCVLVFIIFFKYAQ